MTDAADNTSPVELPEGDYAIIECFGHQTIIGRVAEVERFGTKMLQIEPIFNGTLMGPILQAGGSLYRFTPCTKEIAAKRGATETYQLPTAVRATLEPLKLSPPVTQEELDQVAEEFGEGPDDCVEEDVF